MINLLLANENINKYKYDYSGYLVIVDQIRTKEVLLDNKLKKMQSHLKLLKEKYKEELEKISKIEERKMIHKNVSKMNKKQLVDELTYIYHRLAAVGYIRLGIEKEIGII